jgi:transcriptional regulator with XRE-family HTH domain
LEHLYILKTAYNMNERERIELLMKCYGMTPSQFADRTGIQRASVSHIISGRNKPSLEVMQKIYEAFPELDIRWLMTGVGEEPVVGGAGSHALSQPENTLFSQPIQPENQVNAQVSASHAYQTAQYQAVTEQEQPLPKGLQPARPVERQRKPVAPKVRQQPIAERRIKEIRIFYSDGTYETLFPEK